MKVRGSIGKWRWLWLGATVCGSVLAEPRIAQEPATTEPAPVVSEPPLRLSLGTSATGWSARAALDLRRIEQKQFSGLSIVELPPEGIPTNGRTRPRHALSVSSEYPKMMLRSMGIDATDCATRFRMPTKLRRDVDGSGSSIEFRADLGLACRF